MKKEKKSIILPSIREVMDIKENKPFGIWTHNHLQLKFGNWVSFKLIKMQNWLMDYYAKKILWIVWYGEN